MQTTEKPSAAAARTSRDRPTVGGNLAKFVIPNDPPLTDIAAARRRASRMPRPTTFTIYDTALGPVGIPSCRRRVVAYGAAAAERAMPAYGAFAGLSVTACGDARPQYYALRLVVQRGDGRRERGTLRGQKHNASGCPEAQHNHFRHVEQLVDAAFANGDVCPSQWQGTLQFVRARISL